jgi:hypothetical protein
MNSVLGGLAFVMPPPIRLSGRWNGRVSAIWSVDARASRSAKSDALDSGFWTSRYRISTKKGSFAGPSRKLASGRRDGLRACFESPKLLISLSGHLMTVGLSRTASNRNLYCLKTLSSCRCQRELGHRSLLVSTADPLVAYCGPLWTAPGHSRTPCNYPFSLSLFGIRA